MGVIHFLHIGRNAGTEIRRWLVLASSVSPQVSFQTHGHHVRLVDLPEGARYFFSLRNPVERFVSGFYSRKRQGAPRYLSPMSDHEKRAFSNYNHANDLAEDLFVEGQTGRDAVAAITSISHTAMNQIDWFARRGHFLEVNPPLVIVRQCRFEADLRYMFDRLGIPAVPEPTNDAVLSHRNVYTHAPELSERARGNLEAWFTQDLEFFSMCMAWAEEKQGKAC